MKWLNHFRMRSVVVGCVAAIVLGGGTAKADFVFGEPTNLGATVNSTVRDQQPTISSDGLELYFFSERAGGLGDWDVYVTTRSTPDDPWGEPVNLGLPVNTSAREAGPRLSPDDLSLFFTSDRPGGSGATDLHVTTRLTKNDAWGIPVNLGPTVNSSDNDGAPSISADGLELFFQSPRSGGFGNADLYVTTRPTIHDDWRAPVNLGWTVNTSDYEWGPNISSDRLTLHFYSLRPGGFGSNDIYMTSRSAIGGDWGEPVTLGPIINSSSKDGSPTFSADGSMLYFASNRPGAFGDYDLYQAPVIPIVDLNGDGIVDAQDMCIVVDNWGTDYSLCDIGPMPWGDGIVDVQDLIALAEHLFEEVNDPNLLAHWPLDEAEGIIAGDSAGDNDAYVMGAALWQPDGGQVNGAIELDGVDDYIIAGSPLNPADGPFSVFAWIKGGAPGQGIVAQQVIGDWLSLDADGGLMTELKDADGLAVPLISETIITDGQWHRVGLVWDGSRRTLCVDGVTVAEDVQVGLEGSDRGLYIGVGTDFAPDSFFSGLIDDVRIYNRAVKP